MILMIDNYDSFTYNLVQYLGQLGQDVAVYRNDVITIDEIRKLAPDAIFLSPGPCTPKEAGITVDVIREFHKSVPIMGVCLGHQAIGYTFGGNVVRAGRLMHGKTSQILHDGNSIFKESAKPFYCRTLPLPACGESFPSVLPFDQRRDRRRRNHGHQASGVPCGRYTIPS